MPVTTIWTALPHGAGNATLHLSAAVSFRLTTPGGQDMPLTAFPDVASWPAMVDGMKFSVDLGATTGVPATVVSARPSTALWRAVFPPAETVVRSHTPEDHSAHPLSSFSVVANRALLLGLHTQVGLASPDQRPFWNVPVGTAGDQRMVGLIGLVRDWTFSRAEALKFTEVHRHAGNDVPARVHLARLVTFYNRDPVTGTAQVPLPTPQQLKARFDFHKIIASLGDYPALLVPLGLVIDLTIPRAAFPVAPQPATQLLRVRPTWPPTNGGAPVTGCPATTTLWDGSRFEAASADGTIADGYLALEAEPTTAGGYDVVEVDVDGAVLKTVGFANNLAQLPTTGTVSTDDSSGPPALRSAGLSLVHTGRADVLGGRLASNAATEATLGAAPEEVTFTAEQLVRGYRLDIWDTATKAWHSLMARDGHYAFASDPAQDRDLSDESFVQLGVASAASPSGSPAATDTLYVHESVARWDGWSLAAPRPGLAVSHETDPTAPPEAGDTTAGTTTGLSATFRATPGTLPRLRFGHGYRIRARVADLSGHSLPASDPSDAHATGPAPAIYRRYEPVAAPVLVLRHPLGPGQPGQSLERLVIRTRNISPAQDTDLAGPPDARHVAPPRTSVGMAETLGALDGPDGRPRGDAATYAMLAAKDAGKLPTDGPDPQHQYPTVPGGTLALPYLPDPLARAAALGELPGTTSPTRLTNSPGGLIVTTLPGTAPRPGSVVIVRYGDAWPQVTPFQLVLSEGSGAPSWDDVNRLLQVRLPKASVATATLSSVLDAGDLPLMAMWELLREAVEPGPNLVTLAVDQQEALDKLVGLVSQLAVEGGLWQLTPSRQVTFVHAVQQPLGLPQIQTLSATRGQGDTFASLSGVITAHGTSTAKVELLADWTDPVDDPSQPAPSTLDGQGAAGELVIDNPAGSVVQVDGRAVGQFDAPDRLVLGYPEETPVQFPRHEMHDTRHRLVSYTPVSASRFRDYFAPGEPGGFSRTGNPYEVHVPSSRPPAAPRVAYVVPTFGWQREEETNLRAHLRSGGGLRVYLERPWYSSGAGEQLGVVLWEDNALPSGEENLVSRYVTTWGRDPIYASPWDRDPLPHVGVVFPLAASSAIGLRIAELPGATVSVAAHDVVFDPDRRLWYADIVLNAGHAYHPFVRLALARYQQNAVVDGNADVRLSPVVQADFAALPMDRGLLVTYDPYSPDVLAVTVSGTTYTATAGKDGAPAAGGSYVEVSVQQRIDGVSDPDLGWQPFAAPVAADVDVTSPLLWHGHVTLPTGRRPGEYRIAVKEFETLLADPTIILLDGVPTRAEPEEAGPVAESGGAGAVIVPPVPVVPVGPPRVPVTIFDPVPTPRLVYIDTMVV